MMWRWFRRADGVPFFFAGIWRPWTGDRGTKKAPNVGEHMLLMTAEDIDRWLQGNSVEDALAMQTPASDNALVVGRPVKPEKKAA